MIKQAIGNWQLAIRSSQLTGCDFCDPHSPVEANLDEV